jgi:hypothetical protein
MFESLQALANALKTDVATVERVLLRSPEADTDSIIEGLGLSPGVEDVELEIHPGGEPVPLAMKSIVGEARKELEDGNEPGAGDRWGTKTDADQTLGLSRAKVRENSMLPNLSPDARALATYMSDISEEFWCAGWMRDLEFMLWSVIEEGEAYASLTLTRDQLATLKSLSNACKGWIVFRRDTQETFVSMPEWMQTFAAWFSEKDPTNKDESR